MNERTQTLTDLLARRILLLDGAMGTQLQQATLTEKDYRGTRFQAHPHPLSGNHDVLCLTRPDAVRRIHEAYLDAGADILETNSFNANAVSQADYGLESLARDMNRAAAAIARQAADAWTTLDPLQPRFVAGVLGPTNKTASLSPDVENPGARGITFAQLVEAYRDAAIGLIEGGADLLMIETVFDTLNAKAAIYALETCFDDGQPRLPLMISGTITDRSGRTLSGQTVDAFRISVSHASTLLSLGFNCALGAADMRPHVGELAAATPFFVSMHPNAGLPNAFGGYDQTPAELAAQIEDCAREGLINLAGGCCGTTPEHIRALRETLAGIEPRKPPQPKRRLSLSGLETLSIVPQTNFVNIGERTNVSGSRRFLNLIKANAFEEAVAIARQQVENGAQILDVNMDEGMLDGVGAMRNFLNLIAAEPDIARVPVMPDSSRWEVLEAALQCLQGKSIVNSLSLKAGEQAFLTQARQVRRYGAAVLVMAFDEQGQADSLERRLGIAVRATHLLTAQAGFPPEDIVLDPNVFAIGTGIEAHNRYAADFFEALRHLKQALPLCHFSGGISNVSFAFRGNERLRSWMHALFLYHAIDAGLDMGIVNAGALPVIDEIPPEARAIIDDALLNRHPEAAENLLALAQRTQLETVGAEPAEADPAWRKADPAERLAYALVHGLNAWIVEDVEATLAEGRSPLSVIEGPLMDGMREVGDRFGAGRMFLPQVVKSARVMKQAVARLQPLLEAESQAGRHRAIGRIVLATVKGDVHDIGKNIVAVVLQCNGFEVIDLGVMTPCETILETARRENADLIGLSGLITPSLDEMVHVARELKRQGFKLPLLIGGATTSERHAAVKIAPEADFPVLHVRDASLSAQVAGALMRPDTRKALAAETQQRFQKLQDAFHAGGDPVLLPIAEARRRRLQLNPPVSVPASPRQTGILPIPVPPVPLLLPMVDWQPLFQAWDIKGSFPALLDHPETGQTARSLWQDARELLETLTSRRELRLGGVAALYRAVSRDDDILLFADDQSTDPLCRLPMLRQQRRKPGNPPYLSMADFVLPEASGCRDTIGLVVTTGGLGAAERAAAYRAAGDDYRAILSGLLADRLAGAYAAWLDHVVRRDWWGCLNHAGLRLDQADVLADEAFRPAPGYPILPDHSLKAPLFALTEATERAGVSLTDHYMMVPESAVCAIMLDHPEARYFDVGPIGDDQLQDYARRRRMAPEAIRRWLSVKTIAATTG